MAKISSLTFSPPVVGCLVKKGLKKGGHGHPKTPLAKPLRHKLHVIPLIIAALRKVH